MRFGYCTGFAAGMMGPIHYPLLDDIQAAGYDYVEFPLMQVAALSETDFSELRRHMEGMDIACDACCNMFPASVRLVGPEADDHTVRSYLDLAFARMQALGAKTIVLGSSGARNLAPGMTKAEGDAQLSRLISEVITPYLDKYGVMLVMEPINRGEANYINTLPDGMDIVNLAKHPRVTLLADSVHLLYENESPKHIDQYASYLNHIHLCESERALPYGGLSDGLADILAALKRIGYNGTASFEPMPHDLQQMKAALDNIKAAL